MNYSISLLDQAGRTQRTHFGAYPDDDAALTQARDEVASSAIVEVWKNDLLLARLYHTPEDVVLS